MPKYNNKKITIDGETFDSIKEGYAASKDGDDVKEAVDMRLSKLESVMNEMN